MPSIQDDDFDPAECIAEFNLEDFDSPPQPVSPIQELAQSVAASLTPITAAAPSGAERWKEMGNAQARAQKRLNELVRSDPELSCIANEHYGMRFEAAPFSRPCKSPATRMNTGFPVDSSAPNLPGFVEQTCDF